MMQASQRERSDEGKRRLAVQLMDSPSVDAAVKHLCDWDSVFALHTLLELHARSGWHRALTSNPAR